MADIVNEQGKEPEVSKEDMEKLESVKKADAAVNPCTTLQALKYYIMS